MNTLQAGPLNLQPYGLAVAAAAAVALLWIALSGKKNLKPGTVSLYALFAVPLGWLLARLAQCLVSQGWYLFRQDFFFNVNRGGYMLYGALVGCLLAAIPAAKLTGEKAARILDHAAAPGALMIACCRMAEGLTGSGYGRNILDWFDPWMEESMIAWEDPSPICRFPFGVQDYYGEWNWCIFVPEAIAALIFMLILIRQKKGQNGNRITLMLLMYAGMQTLFESMRQDAIPRWGFVRVNQLFSVVIAVAVLFISCRRLGKSIPAGRKLLAWVELLLCCVVIIAMEFALEQKIGFLIWMRMDLCWLVMALGSLGIILSINPLRKKAFA